MEKETFYLVLKSFAAGSLLTMLIGVIGYIIVKLERGVKK